MWNDLSLSMGGADGYTVIMVMSPNSIYGNDTDVFEQRAVGPNSARGPTTDGVSTGPGSFTVRDQAIWMTTEAQPAPDRGADRQRAGQPPRPCYVALVVGRPQTTLYAASGPSKVISKALAAGAGPGVPEHPFLARERALLPTSRHHGHGAARPGHLRQPA